MNDKKKMDRNIETLIWGALFIFWGLTLLIDLPGRFSLIGVGLILLAANAGRYFLGIRINGFSTGIGILALVWGGLEFAGAFLRLPFELPIFAIVLIALGLFVLLGIFRSDAARAKEA